MLRLNLDDIDRQVLKIIFYREIYPYLVIMTMENSLYFYPKPINKIKNKKNNI